MESNKMDVLYQQSFNGANRQPMRVRVSAFDVDYPTPQECLQILSANSGAKTQALKKKLNNLTRKRPNSAIPIKLEKPGIPDKALTIQSLQIQQRYELSQIQQSTIGESPSEPFDKEAATSRLLEFVPECKEIGQEVIAKIVEAAEEHLRQLLSEISKITGHRLESLRMNPDYQPISDPRKQMKLYEEYKEKELAHKKAAEKEELLIKSKAKQGAKKSRQLNQEMQEERLNRDANEIAIAALGGVAQDKNESTMINLGNQDQRPRRRRISLRDFLCLLDCKNSPESALIRNHSMYGIVHMTERGHFATI